MSGIFNELDKPFAKFTPTSKDPASPGPLVTAIAESSFIDTLAT